MSQLKYRQKNLVHYYFLAMRGYILIGVAPWVPSFRYVLG